MFYSPSFKPNINIALASIHQIQQDQECKKLIEDDQEQHERERKEQMDKWDSESDSYDPIKATLDERLPLDKQKFYEVIRRKGSTSVQMRKIWRKNEYVKYKKRCISP